MSLTKPRYGLPWPVSNLLASVPYFGKQGLFIINGTTLVAGPFFDELRMNGIKTEVRPLKYPASETILLDKPMGGG